MRLLSIVFSAFFLIFLACSSSSGKVEKPKLEPKETSINFIDEYIFPEKEFFKNTLVGGLSGIDYHNGKWYFICDDSKAPVRFYTAEIDYDLEGFNILNLTDVVEFKEENGQPLESGVADPESIRITKNNTIVWSSEGGINNGINPFIRESSLSGDYIRSFTLSNKFKVSSEENIGPRNNGVFEALSLDANARGYWTATELPLKQDGAVPTTTEAITPVRIVNIDEEGNFGKEFVHELNSVPKPAINDTNIEVNGLVELLAFDTNKFLALERSFSSGYTNGGNTVKIYSVDISNATNVSGVSSLEGAVYTASTKKLLFDFESIRSKLTNGIVDNIEGITFGPDFKNGNRSLVVIADNNFSSFAPQLNQFIVLELENLE
ncbi:esterase-like activity of phytase family protein [uncultured Maribacter sp.]|uniref:esterase-like activity of phytase family protein n=1 Tax=uncultured Maribacter sp. TaxID=431308 RepID=UPI00260B36A3|nr:esterase-like activity of phytase family protein [uncultured Maribacter sp.]